MIRLAGGVLALVLVLPALAAEDKSTSKSASPAEQYQTLVKEFQDARQAFFKEYSAAKNDQERQKLVSDKLPQPAKWAPKFMALAEKYPDDPAAIDALERVCRLNDDGLELRASGVAQSWRRPRRAFHA